MAYFAVVPTAALVRRREATTAGRSLQATSSRCFPSVSCEMLAEEGGKLVERDQVDPVVQVHVAGARHDQELLRFRSEPVGMLAEDARVCLVARDEQHGSWRDPVEMLERPEERHLCATRARECCRRARVLPARGAIVIVEL